MKKNLLKLSLINLLLLVSSCSGSSITTSKSNTSYSSLSSSSVTSKSSTTKTSSSSSSSTQPIIEEDPFINFEGAETPLDYEKFNNEVRINNVNNNEKGSYGLVYSPYYNIKINDFEMHKAYATNATNGLMSFSMIRFNKNDILTIRIQYYRTIEKFEIYCLGDIPTYIKSSQNTIDLIISEQQTYTLKINDDLTKCISLFLESPKVFENPNNYNVDTFEPGTHDFQIIAKENTILYFKKGIHDISRISLESNCQIYFEEGSYLKCIQPDIKKEEPVNPKDSFGVPRWVDFLDTKDSENIQIYGLGFIDFYKLDWHARGGLKFLRTKNIKIEDIAFNNIGAWCMDIACSKSVNISNVKIFGYRQNSDGICVEDSKDVKVLNCFARSGDDLFEVKSRYSNYDIVMGNIRFEKCIAWPDKARGFGIIAETKKPISDVHYDDCICLAYTPKWMKYLGACIIHGESTGLISNITFQNIRIYNNIYYPITLTLRSPSTQSIKDILFENIIIENEYDILISNEIQEGTISNITFSNIKMATFNLKDKINKIKIDGEVSNIITK